MRARRLLPLSLVGALALVAPPARADEASEKAKHHYEEGMAHYNVGEFREALGEFKSGYFAKKDPVFLFNLGQCYRQLGDPESAARQYRAYLRVVPEASNRAAVEKFITAAEAEIQRRQASQPPTEVRPPAPSSTPAPAPVAEPVAAAHEPVKGAVTEPQKEPATTPPHHAPVAAIAIGVIAGVVVVGGAVGLGLAFGLPNNATPDPAAGSSYRVMF